MADDNKPFFAVPSDAAQRTGDPPRPSAWGDDAEAIAAAQGLGSYGGTPEETAERLTVVEGLLAEVTYTLDELRRRQRVGLVVVAVLAAVGWWL